MPRQSCKQHPQCVGRVILGPDGHRITNAEEFLAKAAEVSSVFAPAADEPASTSSLPLCQRMLNAIRDAYSGDNGRGLSGDETFSRFGLCSEHARQLARGFVVAAHYHRCYPDAPLPPPKLVWSVGSVAFHREEWTVPALVVLLRCWSFGVWDEHDIDRAVTGLRDSNRKQPFEKRSDGDVLALLGTAGILGGWLGTEREVQAAPEQGEFSGVRSMAGLMHQYASADEDFAEMVLIYCWELRPRRAPSADVATQSVEDAHPF